MSTPVQRSVSSLLRAIEKGDQEAGAELFAILYDELRSRAGRLSRRQPKSLTLQATALVHEAYLRLVHQTQQDFRDRAHFIACASTAMRHALVDHARARQRRKRRAEGVEVQLDGIAAAFEERAVDLESLDDALRRMSEFSPDMVRAVEMRFFGGASVEETASMLGMSKRTFERRFEAARAWLRREIH